MLAVAVLVSALKLDAAFLTLLIVGVERMVMASAVMYLDILLMLFTDMFRVDTSDNLVLLRGGETKAVPFILVELIRKVSWKLSFG